MSAKKFYLTTPIYYVNARPHIGHAYTTIVGDVLARRHRLLGEDVYFLTGTDEHGQKIERSATAAGIPPQQFADQVSASFEALWKRMGITNDDYIRTTEPRHKRGAQKLFRTLYERGFIYLASYTGSYCVSDEAFIDAPIGTPCPDCGRLLEEVTEENFFFKLSEFQKPLIDLIESGDLVITPESARNEVLSFIRGNWIAELAPHFPTAKQHLRELNQWDDGVNPTIEEMAQYIGTANSGLHGKAKKSNLAFYVPGALKDLSISRSSFTWGIPVPEPAASEAKQPHVIYVWLDALANYMTALGYGSDDETLWQKFWPADLHLVGKEITRFHCVYWPAFLLALNPEYPSVTWDTGIVDVKSAFAPVHLEKSRTDPPKLTAEQHSAWAKKFLPQQITAHGWLLFDNSKMSKSKGNIVRTETILDAFGNIVYASLFPNSSHAEQDLFAADVLRYFLLREIPFGQDGSFTFDALVTRYNADLANGYGNLVSRTLSMIEKYCDGKIPSCRYTVELQLSYLPEFFDGIERIGGDRQQATIWRGAFLAAESNLSFHNSLELIQHLISRVDLFLSESKPWKLDGALEEERSRRDEILYGAADALTLITFALHAYMPTATAKVWHQLGFRQKIEDLPQRLLGPDEKAPTLLNLRNFRWNNLQPGTKLGPLGPIFPRADKGLAQIMTDLENPTPAPIASTDPAAAPRTTTLPEPGLTVAGSHATTTGPDPAPSIPSTLNPEPSPQITIDDFAKIDLRVAQITLAERIPKADKLLRLEVDLGPLGRRQILSGIAEHYTPEELLGRRIVVIANLAPRKMRGLESHGMLLAASEGDHGKPHLATCGEEIALGSRLK